MQATQTAKLLRFILFILAVSFYSCRSAYNQNIMFKTTGSVNLQKLKVSLASAERNYIIQPNDYLDVRVYTNKGERIFDPNGELPFGTPGVGTNDLTRSTPRVSGTIRNNVNNQSNLGSNTEFLVQHDGTIKLPMVDYVKISGLTLLQADSLLQTLYTKYYIQPFVTTRVTNNRVFVLGAVGGQGSGSQGAGTVIQMANDNMNLLEVVALAGGIPHGGKAQNVRIIRNYMSAEPMVQIIDLSTIEGMRQASLHIEPNDVVYIEPNQRIFFEVLRDAAPVINTFTALISAYLLITLGRN